jgi:predicted secreted hydrolase
VMLNGSAHAVHGDTWFDHEWSSSQLGTGEVGWDWLGLEWDDGSALMLYRMRLASGELESSSSGTWIAPDGITTQLGVGDFQMTPIAFWKSGNGARYPTAWRIALPAQHAQFTISATLENQELKLGTITYWEGAIDANGVRNGKPIKGRGYLELTGYAGTLGEQLRR